MSSTNLPHKGVALALASFPLTGVIGIDKLYVGKPGLFALQLALSLTLIGLIVSVPWNIISIGTLLVAILYSSSTISSIYPGVNWAKQTEIDTYIAYTVVLLWIFSIVLSQIRAYMISNKKDENKD